MFDNDGSASQVCAPTSLYLNKVLSLFFRERTTFLSGFWDHRLQHASHLYLPEANEAAGDEFTGAGELCPCHGAVQGTRGVSASGAGGQLVLLGRCLEDAFGNVVFVQVGQALTTYYQCWSMEAGCCCCYGL